MSTVKNYTSNFTPHWSAIRDLRVAADISGAGSHEWVREGIDFIEVKGAALGIVGAATHSHIGFFTDNNNNTIIIAREDTPEWSRLWAEVLSKRPIYRFNFERNMGSGGAYEANSFIVAGREERVKDYAGWVRWEDMPLNIAGHSLEKYNNMPKLLEQIESSGKKFNAPIVLLLSGEPITFSSIFKDIVGTLFAIATPFLGYIGIPATLIPLIEGSAKNLIQNGTVSLGDISNVASLIVPSTVRKYIPKARNVYSSMNNNDYANIAKELKISDDFPGLKVVEALNKSDLNTLLKNSSASFDGISKTVQNITNFNTVNKIRNVARSGSATMNIIDEGSITKVPAIQDLLVSASSDGTHLPVVPGVTDIMRTAINETQDVNANVDVFKASCQTLLGFPVGVDSFDALTLSALKEKAYKNAQENNVRTFTLPQSLPDWKKSAWAIDITKDTGVTTLSGLPSEFM